MNKAQFVELVQASGDYKTKVEAEAAIKAFTEAVTTALVKKEDGKVPGTDKTYTTQDKMVPKFKAGKGLKDRVAAGK